MITETINQRDLRLRSKEIMDSVEAGQEFIVTRDGRPMATLAPLKKKPTFISRERFMEIGRGAPVIDLAQIRAEADAYFDPYVSDPYER